MKSGVLKRTLLFPPAPKMPEILDAPESEVTAGTAGTTLVTGAGCTGTTLVTGAGCTGTTLVTGAG